MRDGVDLSLLGGVLDQDRVVGLGMCSVVDEKLAGSDEGSGVQGLVGVDETSSLLTDGLKWVAVGERSGDVGGGGLESSAGAAEGGSILPVRLQEERRSAGEEGRSHAGAREDGERSKCARVGGKNVTWKQNVGQHMYWVRARHSAHHREQRQRAS